MRFDGGWFKFYRKAIFGDIGQNGYCLALWVWLLGAANYQCSKIRFNGNQKNLTPGQIVTSYQEIAEALQFSKSTIKRHLDYLKSTARIEVNASHRGTLISILNYKQYQAHDADLIKRVKELEERERVSKRVRNENVSESLNKEVKKERSKIHVSAETETGKKITPEEVTNLLKEAYSIYPRRALGGNMGKSVGVKRIKLQITTRARYESFRESVENYANYCALTKIAKTKHVKMFSSFCVKDVWPDWIDWIPVVESGKEIRVEEYQPTVKEALANDK